MITPSRPRELHLAIRRRGEGLALVVFINSAIFPLFSAFISFPEILKAVKENHLCSILEIERINQRFTMEFEDRNPFEAGSVAGM